MLVYKGTSSQEKSTDAMKLVGGLYDCQVVIRGGFEWDEWTIVCWDTAFGEVKSLFDCYMGALPTRNICQNEVQFLSGTKCVLVQIDFLSFMVTSVHVKLRSR